MAITTDRTINIRSSGTFNIGISKPLNNYTFDDLWAGAYAGVTATDFKHICETYNADIIGKGHEGESPLNYVSKNINYYYATSGSMSYQQPAGYYCKVLLLYSTTYHQKAFTKFDTSVYVVTSCNMQNIVYTTTGGLNNTNPSFPRRPDFNDIKYINDTKDSLTSLDGYIIPVLLIKYNNTGYVYALFQKNNTTSYDYSTSMITPPSMHGYEWGEQLLPYDGDATKGVAVGLNINFPNCEMSKSTVYDWNKPVTEDENITAYIRSVPAGHGGIIYRANTIDKLNDWMSYFGMQFFTNGLYKPIIKDGVITGYTDDLTTESEFDTYTGNTKHDVPDKPPVPPDKDDIDSMDIDTSELGGAGIAGAVTYYTMTNVQLSSFMDELAEQSAEHTDIATGFVSASYIPNILDTAVRATSMPIRVKGVTTTATGNKVILQHSILIASVSVPRRHNNAYDTMTKYYLYTPYTDVIPLNYKCYGRTLNVYLLPSIQDCNADIVVQSDGVTIAKQTVSLGSALAISAENNAEKSTAIVNACSKYAVSAGGVIGGALTGNPIAVAGSAVGVVASTVNALNALGNSYIHSYGTTTGTTLSLNPRNIYVIEHVVQPDKPSNYARTNGNLVNMEMEITSGMGYTKLGNPRINTNLTAPEYAELINALESGVIL